MDFFSQTYVALRGPTGAPQSANETIARLSDRLSPATLLADRRAAVLSLKGLAHKHKLLVGSQALAGLQQIVITDASVDPEIGRAALETVHSLCDIQEAPQDHDARELALKHSDLVLNDPKLVHSLCSLFGEDDFWLRYAACTLLTTLLLNRPQAVQAHFLTAAGGPARVVSLLEDGRDMLAREALTMLASLIRKSSEIQKVLAFDGVFEKLFGIIAREGGLDGGAYAEEALKCVDTLLRFNTSNQSYFLETPLPSQLCTLIYFNPAVLPEESVPQEFSLQFWSREKGQCAVLLLEIVGILLSAKGASLREGYAFTRMLIEMGLASNAPTRVKIQCLRHLPADATPMLTDIFLTPYMPVPETNGEEWDRLEAATALDALIELMMNGEYNGLDAAQRQKESMDLRAAAVGVFENFLRDDRVKEAIVAGMLPPKDAGPNARSPVTPLLFALLVPPRSPPDRAAIVSFQFAAAVFAHLLRHAPHCKTLARQIVPPALAPVPLSLMGGPTGAFFVPADGAGSPQEAGEEEDELQTLLQTLTEHLSLAFLGRGRDGVSEYDAREWDRLIISHLALLTQWLWEDPHAVRAFLEAGGMGVLVEQLNLPSEMDVVIPGLCAFLLGICYEFNREPGEITRASMHPILNRLGPSTLAGRLARLRDDDRLKVVSPDFWVLPCPSPAALNPAYIPQYDNETEIWFDWAFVDFWKSVNQTIVRGIVADPDAPPSSAAQSGEESVLVASLRNTLQKQAADIEALTRRLQEAAGINDAAAKGALAASNAKLATVEADLATSNAKLGAVESDLLASNAKLAAVESDLAASNMKLAPLEAKLVPLEAELADARTALEAEKTRRAEVEKEQEDLLVLLDELSDKRRKEKARMREAGWEVSDDDDDADDAEDGEDET